MENMDILQLINDMAVSLIISEANKKDKWCCKSGILFTSNGFLH